MTTTVGDIASDVRTRCDQSNSQEVSDDTMILWISQLQQDLYDAVIELEVYNVTQAQFTVSPSSVVTLDDKVGFPLPSDFYKVWRLSRQMGTGQWCQVPAIHQSQLDQTSWPAYMTGGVPFGPQVQYCIVPPNCLIVPAANVGALYTLNYYPVLPELTSLADSVFPLFDGSGWYKWITLGACIIYKTKLREDASDYALQQAAEMARIKRSASNRDVTYGHRLDPNRGRQRGWGGLFGGGGWGGY